MAAQAQKHVTHNEALRALDALVQLMVLDKDLVTPPGSPAEGARYIVAVQPHRRLVGQAGRIAAYQDAAWAFHPPREGWLAWVADEDTLYVSSGTAWAEHAAGGEIGSLVEDATPQLGGDLDGNGHRIGFGSGTGITDDAGNEQLVFHKTASAVNQVGIANAAAGGAPQIAAEGGDADVDLVLPRARGPGTPKPQFSASTRPPTPPPGWRSPLPPRCSTTPAAAISTRSTRTPPVTPPAWSTRPTSRAAPRWGRLETTISISR